MKATTSYRRFPSIKITGHDNAAAADSSAIQSRLLKLCKDRTKTVIVAECYPGVDQAELLQLFSPLKVNTAIHSDDLALPPAEIDAQIEREITKDPVFGIMTTRRLEEFYPVENLDKARSSIDHMPSGIALVYGVGASLVCEGDILILADLTRWEIQLRYRRGMSNWRTTHTDLPRNEKYKRGFFAEWRWADRIKDRLLPRIDFYLDMTTQQVPAMWSAPDCMSGSFWTPTASVRRQKCRSTETAASICSIWWKEKTPHSSVKMDVSPPWNFTMQKRASCPKQPAHTGFNPSTKPVCA